MDWPCSSSGSLEPNLSCEARQRSEHMPFDWMRTTIDGRLVHADREEQYRSIQNHYLRGHSGALALEADNLPLREAIAPNPSPGKKPCKKQEERFSKSMFQKSV